MRVSHQGCHTSPHTAREHPQGWHGGSYCLVSQAGRGLASVLLILFEQWGN